MDNHYSVTRTKLIIPRRREELLTRQRLLDMVNDLLDLKLVILAAPAGYGKTSLLIDFADHTHWPIGWLALDPLDQDPFRFLAHFISAIQARFPDFGKNAFSVLNNTPQEQMNLPAMVTTLVNDIYENIPEHFILILDDYHLVEDSEPVNQFVNQFLQDVDENCHLIVSSRRLLTLPDMPLLVARNQAGGISFEEISFSPAEIQAFLLQNYHKTVSDQQADALSRETEGWITGLMLSAQLLDEGVDERLRLNRVSGVDLYDYMAQQVFDQQPPEIKDFLLRTSIMEEFNLKRCQNVIGQALGLDLPWKTMMDKVLMRNLFVLPVGEGREAWLRYHHLFRDFLQYRMQTERPEETKALTVALADDYAQEKDWERAFVLYKEVGAADKMVSLVEAAGPPMIIGGKILTLKEWMAALPPEQATSQPSLLSLQGAILMSTGDVNQSITLLDTVIDQLIGTDDIEVLATSLLRRTHAHRMLGDYKAALSDNRRALLILENKPELGWIRAEALRHLGVTLYYQGDFKQALNVLKQSLRLYESYNDEHNIPKLLFNIGLMHVVLGDYVRGEMMYQKALAHWQTGGNLAWASELINNLGILQQLRGDFESAAKSFEKAVEYARISNSPRAEALSLTSLGDLYRDLDASREALDVYKKALNLAKQVEDSFLLFYLDLAEGVLNRINREQKKAELAFQAAEEKTAESSSSYNANLLNTERSMYYLFQTQYRKALDLAQHAYTFFQSEGNENEAHRAAFCCVLALAGEGEKDRALVYLDKILPTLLENDYATPLMVQAREFKKILNGVKDKHALKLHFSRILERVGIFEDKLPRLRRKIRHQASVVPFAPPRMVIQSFGKAQVQVNTRLVSSSQWQTQTARDLFFLFLAHPEGLTKEQVGLNFWPDATQDELRLRFKNTLYRLRRAIGRQSVLLQDDYYQFNWSLDYEYDVETFTTAFKQAQKHNNAQEKIKFLKQAVEQYKGEYLNEIEEVWAITDRQKYHQMYMDSLMHLAFLYMEKKSHKTALRYCYQALTEDACLEDAHRLAMRIHAATGNRAAIVRQYEHCQAALTKEINAPPSQQTRDLYETLIQN